MFPPRMSSMRLTRLAAGFVSYCRPLQSTSIKMLQADLLQH